jgi:uncharacterized repeat protein (TIGR02543 family)
MSKLLSRMLCIALISLLTACGGGGGESTKSNSAAGVTFSFAKGALVSAKTAKTLKTTLSTTVDPTAKYVLISATDSGGTLVLNNYKADIYALNNSYLTAPIPLTAGNYQVTSFIVLDSNNSILYLTPTQTASADVKALVSTVLPMSFQVAGTQATSVALQVLAPDSDVSDFGYPGMSVTPVSYISFLSSVEVQQNGAWQLTDANLTVNGISYSHPASTSKLRVATAASYTLAFSKTGYFPQTITLSPAQIADYQVSALDVRLVLIPTTFVVAFNSNGGTAVSSQSVDKNGYALAPTDPIKPGYTFGGWYYAGLVTPFVFASTPITADLTLYAKWIYNPAQYLSWTGTGAIMIMGASHTSPYQLPAGVTSMNVVLSGGAGGNGNTLGAGGEVRSYNALPITAATYTITLGKAGQNGQTDSGGNIGGGGGGGASTMLINGAYVAGAAGGAGGGDGGYGWHSSPYDAPGGLGGSGDAPGEDGTPSDGYLGLHGNGGNGGGFSPGNATVGTVIGTQAGDGTISITFN